MAKVKKVSKSEDAANAVSGLLQLITSGPRFSNHLARIGSERNLTPTQQKRLLKAGVKKFLG